jgi:hypothetical protein
MSAISRKDIETILDQGSDDQICETLVSIALESPDWVWIQEKCIQCSQHASWSVRAIAATCIGHLARIHRKLDRSIVMPRLRELRSDPRVAPHVDNALDDIRVFVPGALD